MARHDKKYDSLRDKAARGEYELVAPLDYLVLDKLQEAGTLFAGLYPLGDTVTALGKKFDQIKGGLPSGLLSARLRVLHTQGLVVAVNSGVGTGGTKVWQRTETGKAVVTKWKEESSGNS